ncbi:unnamed protein product [Cunninghamella blakesleeana]
MSNISTEDGVDIDKYFSQSEKQLEIDRVMRCFKLDPFSILELPYTKIPTAKDIKMAYRKKSLFIHPDKVQHKDAQDAFAKLKKAESDLNDKAQLSFLFQLIQEAKINILKGKGEQKIKMKNIQLWEVEEEVKLNINETNNNANDQNTNKEDATNDKESDQLKNKNSIISAVDDDQYPFILTPQGNLDIQAKLKELLIEMELRRRRQIKRELETEGAQARKKEQEVEDRKRKAEEQKEWEDTRDKRVNTWRDFQKKGAKKKKSKKL